ncbi:MAG: hypothetical protein QN127_06695 [Armatimonadota bacterium]|nr:hypothetical protein [Armatimonadota bacterium]MDR7509031.1 hypothetical protein [Armatimonadota bacterium]
MAMRVGIPYDVPGTFHRAQLHCHTTESDGRFTPRDLLRMYRDAGYSFVALTDHNRVTRCDDLNGSDFLAIPGTEDTVSRLLRPLGPHMGRLFVDVPLREGTAQQRVDRTVASGGIVSLCHPSWTGNLWTGTWSPQAVVTLRGYHLLEIWNPHSNPTEDLRRWDMALTARGPQAPVWGVAVDDCHHAGQFDRGWIMVKVPAVTAEALRAALLGGAFYASTGLSGEVTVSDGRIDVRVDEPARIRFVGRGGRLLAEARGTAAGYRPDGTEGYVRVEATSGGRALWSQPLWVAPE